MADAITRAGAVAGVPALGTFAPPGWKQAVDNVVNNGREEDLDQGTTRGFKTVTGDVNGVHRKSTLNVWGELDATGTFIVSSVTLDYQDWQLRPDGKYFVDEWIHTLNRDASSWNPLHYFQIVNDGNVENSGSQLQSAGDPRKNLATLIAGWAKYRPETPKASEPTKPSEHAPANDDARRAFESLMPAITAPNRLEPPRGGGFGLGSP